MGEIRKEYAIETINGVERPDFGIDLNSVTRNQDLENEIAERFEQVFYILDKYSEYTVTNHIWINTNWWALSEELSNLYKNLINRLPYEPNKVPHINYLGRIIRLCRNTRDWCEKNGLDRETFERNNIDKQKIFLVLL